MYKSLKNKFLIVLIVFFMSILTSGCIANFKAVGYFEEYNEIFVGDVTANLFSGGGNFKLIAKNSGIKCEGSSVVTEIPNKLTCAGQKGEIFGTCSDGRIFRGEYRLATCTIGYGIGTDEFGHVFKFRFGFTEEEVKNEIDRIAKFSGGKPDLPSYTVAKSKAESKTDTNKEKEKEKKIKGGTGFFFANNGLILTNYHVIKGASELIVLTNDGKSHKGQLVIGDSHNDIAILKIESDYPYLNLGSASDVQKGSDVMTLGYPLILVQGYEIKATFGKINALSGFENDIRYFQIDIPIQPGNSGGPLIDSKGNVVGIVTARLDPVETVKVLGTMPQNVNYAIKIDYVIPLLKTAGIDYKFKKNERDTEFKKIIPPAEKSIVLILAK